MLIDYFKVELAVDPATNGPVPGATADVFDASDLTYSTPLAITDMSGTPMSQLVAGPLGIFPPFKCPGHTQIIAKVGDMVTPIDSVLGVVYQVLPDPSGLSNGLVMMVLDGEWIAATVTGDGTVIPDAAGQPDGTPLEVVGGVWALGTIRAPLASPAFTGNPTAPTQTAGNSSTRLATTAYVQGELSSIRGTYAGINAQTGTTYSAVLSDVAKLVTVTNASAITVTLPKDATQAVPIGARIDFVQLGAGKITFAAESGATVNGTPTLITRAQYSAVTAVKIAANTWLLIGDMG